MRRKLIRLAVGSVVGTLCVVLIAYFPGHEFALQVAIWSLIVMAIVLGENYFYFRQKRFWKALAFVVMLHAAVLAAFWRSMPFSTVGVAMLMSFAEAVVLLIVFRWMAETDDSRDCDEGSRF